MFKFRHILVGLCLSACAAAPIEDGLDTEARDYLGIEYATAERWQLPVLNAEWKTAAPFDTFGPACPQEGQTVMVEDCLFLNVFTPENANNAPVLLWIHGGGFRAGFGGDGPKTFTEDGTVVVTFNYRLGKLGFHDWAGWTENDPRNFGQADMVAALDWVQANIAELGGDPNNVTLAGHSAGGMGVQLMMVDPRAKGKFARAWSHAGYSAWPFPKAYSPSNEERQLIKYAPLATQKSPVQLVAEVPHFKLPFIDAPYLREQPADIFEDGKAHNVPYVAGANSYDGAGTLQGAGYTPQSFLEKIDSPALRAAYAKDFAVSLEQAAQRIFGDLRYFRSSAWTAFHQDGWVFYYDVRQNGAAGAYHGQQYDALFDGEPSAFRDAMTAFILTGNPGWAKMEDNAFAHFTPTLERLKGANFAARMSALDAALEDFKK